MSHPLQRHPQVPALLSDKLFAEKNIFFSLQCWDIRDLLQLLANNEGLTSSPQAGAERP